MRGPLNVARSPQGRPVVAQAGSSDVGMELAARTADMVFTAQTTIKEGQDFCNEHARAHGEVRPRAGGHPHLPRHHADRRPYRWPRRRRNTRSCARWSTTASASPASRGWRAASTSSRCDPDGPLPRAQALQCRPRAPGDDHRHGQARHDDPRDRPRARHEPGPSRGLRHAASRSPTTCRNGSRPAPATASTCCSRTIPSRSRNGSTMVDPRAAAPRPVPRPSTRARPSARISACRSRRTGPRQEPDERPGRTRRRPMTRTHGLVLFRTARVRVAHEPRAPAGS